MKVVSVIHERVHLVAALGDVGAVGLDGALVGLRRAQVVAGAHVDVGRHVHQVARAWHERLQTGGARERAFGMRRRLDGVHVVVVGARVERIALQHRLEHGGDLLGALGRRAVRLPELPWMEVHRALGVERRRVEVIGIAADDLAHGVLVVGGERLQVRRVVVRVAAGERLDVGALVRRRAARERERLLHGVVGGALARGIDVEVDVRSECEGDAPPGHGGLRIELSRAREGADGLLVVEGEDQVEALVEEALRLGLGGGDGMAVVTETGHQPDRGGPTRHAVLLGAHLEPAREDEQRRQEAAHLGGRPGNHGGCGERSGGCERRARSSLLRRASGTPRRSSLRLPLSLPGSFASLATITRTDS